MTLGANSTILWPILVKVQSIFWYCLRCQLRHVVLTGQNGRQVITCEGTFIFVPQPAGREPAGLLNVISQRPESLPSKFFMFWSFGGWKWALGFVCALRMHMHSFFFLLQAILWKSISIWKDLPSSCATFQENEIVFTSLGVILPSTGDAGPSGPHSDMNAPVCFCK